MTRDEVATTWRELVLKHTNTLGGACNFQAAAHELAEIVQTALKAALLEALKTVEWHGAGSCWVVDADKIAAAIKAAEENSNGNV